jgi:hypothetical protein
MTLTLASALAITGIAGATPPGVDPTLPEAADEPPNPEQSNPYYDGAVQAPAPQGEEPHSDLGAPPALPSDREPLYGQEQLPAGDEDEEAE